MMVLCPFNNSSNRQLHYNNLPYLAKSRSQQSLRREKGFDLGVRTFATDKASAQVDYEDLELVHDQGSSL